MPQFSIVCGADLAVVLRGSLWCRRTGRGGFSTRERYLSCGWTSNYRCGLRDGAPLRAGVEAAFCRSSNPGRVIGVERARLHILSGTPTFSVGQPI